MNLNAVSIGKNPPNDVNVVIEVPIGGEPIKYEMDKDSGALQVDRFLYTSMRYPGNYGFIPHTLSGDGDPCDVIVANTRAIVPGAIMSCKVVGVLIMEDEAGGDEKLLAVPSAKLTKRYAHVNNYLDLPSITIEQIEHFFAHYKDLEPNKWVKIVRWGDADEARALVLEGVERGGRDRISAQARESAHAPRNRGQHRRRRRSSQVARAIHLGEEPERAIRGRASLAEAKCAGGRDRRVPLPMLETHCPLQPADRYFSSMRNSCASTTVVPIIVRTETRKGNRTWSLTIGASQTSRSLLSAMNLVAGRSRLWPDIGT